MSDQTPSVPDQESTVPARPNTSVPAVPEHQSVRRFNVVPQTVDELKFLGNVFAASGMFPDIRGSAQAIVKIIYGRELGILPMQAMSKIFIVRGRLSLAAEIMALKINTSESHRYKLILHSPRECAIAFYRKIKTLEVEDLLPWREKLRTDDTLLLPKRLGQGENAPMATADYREIELIGDTLYEYIRISYFSIQMAEKAGLVKDDSNWQKWPMNMLFARALSNGARWFCPEVIHGAYTLEEMGVPMVGPDEFDISSLGGISEVPDDRSDESIAYTDAVAAILDPDRREMLNRKFLDPTTKDAEYLEWIKTQAEALGVKPNEASQGDCGTEVE